MPTDVNFVEVHCPPEDAFDYVADFSTHPRWSLDNIRIENVTEGPTPVGRCYRTIGYSLMAQRENEAELEVTEFDRPNRLSFVARSGPREFVHRFTFDRCETGTRIERSMTYDVPPPMQERASAIGHLLDQRRDVGMSMLKGLLEGQLAADKKA